MAGDDPLQRLIDFCDNLGLYESDRPWVCVTHKRFIPCRVSDDTCRFSDVEEDVERVREYQSGLCYFLCVPKVIPVQVALRERLRDSVGHAITLNGHLTPLIAIKPRTPSGVFHGKIDFSQPPWHSPVAMAVFDLHALSRKMERDLRIELGLPDRTRGSSDANTARALEASLKLSEKAEDSSVRDNTREIDKWSRRASVALGVLEIPKRLPRAPGQQEPKCPFCHLRTLRAWAMKREIRCVNPSCKDDEGRKAIGQMEFSPLVSDWVIVWQDGISGVPL